MNTKMDVRWIIEANPEEARLIIAALRGTLKPDQVEAAKCLADAITQDRASASRRLAQQMGKNFDNMQKEREV